MFSPITARNFALSVRFATSALLLEPALPWKSATAQIPYLHQQGGLNDLLFGVSYQYQKLDGGVLKISPHSEYMELLKSRETIPVIPWRPCCPGFFSWEFPKLAVKSVNSTQQPVYFSEMVFNISNSRVDKKPILIAERGFRGMVYLFNEGWGAVDKPSLNFTMEVTSRLSRDSSSSIAKVIQLDGFDKGTSIDFSRYLPPSLTPSEDLEGRISATLSYMNSEGVDEKFPFSGDLYFGPPPAPFIPPSPVVYDAKFVAGEAPATVRLPISQLVNAAGVDQFLVRVGSDRSGSFEFSIDLRSVDGRVFHAGEFAVEIFVPRSSEKALQQASSTETKHPPP
jgi:hypothetical protein